MGVGLSPVPGSADLSMALRAAASRCAPKLAAGQAAAGLPCSVVADARKACAAVT